METALRAYTSGSAHLLRSRTNGVIRLGERANLALASANPFDLPADEIAHITNDLTISNGRLVHDALSSQTAPQTSQPPATTSSASA